VSKACTHKFAMSALPPKAGMADRIGDVRFVPQADSCSAAKTGVIRSPRRRARLARLGTMRPSALAVLRLINNSYLVGAYIECDFKIPSRIGEVIDPRAWSPQ
jgi:hypothetical protein